jgi:drug/metabolite transporter (DMT)-like permease
MHGPLEGGLLIAGTSSSLIFPLGVFLSRRRRPNWVKATSILIAVAGLAWGTLDAVVLYSRLPRANLRRLALYRELTALVAASGSFAVVVDRYGRKDRAQGNLSSRKT